MQQISFFSLGVVLVPELLSHRAFSFIFISRSITLCHAWGLNPG